MGIYICSQISVSSPLKYNETPNPQTSLLNVNQQQQNVVHLKKIPPSYREPPDPNTGHVRVLPPYRDPPPPVVAVTSANITSNAAGKISPNFSSAVDSSTKLVSKRNLKVCIVYKQFNNFCFLVIMVIQFKIKYET